LGQKELGELVTLDSIYEVQQSALDADIQNTMMRILAHEDVAGDELAVKVAKTVSLLELIQEQVPTTTKLTAQCLYSKIGMGNQEQGQHDNRFYFFKCQGGYQGRLSAVDYP